MVESKLGGWCVEIPPACMLKKIELSNKLITTDG